MAAEITLKGSRKRLEIHLVSSLSLPCTRPLCTPEGLGLSQMSALGHLGVTLTGVGKRRFNICLQNEDLADLHGKVCLIALCRGKNRKENRVRNNLE